VRLVRRLQPVPYLLGFLLMLISKIYATLCVTRKAETTKKPPLGGFANWTKLQIVTLSY